MDPLLVIPARYASSRLPGKPLVELCGVSMIRRCHAQCAKAHPKDRIFVATDDDRVARHCRAADIQVIMTPGDCLTGTDRVACVARELSADAYISVQGDEPVIDPADIRAIIDALALRSGTVLNGMCPIDHEADFRSPHIPKVVSRPDGRLLYMSRANVPTDKRHGYRSAKRQVCVYGFPREVLLRFASHAQKTPLEEIEDIEILRFLELGYEVEMISVSGSSISVDTRDDIPKAEAAIQARGLTHLTGYAAS